MYPELRPKVADFISWWIDPVSGRPIPERTGVLRYFVRIAEKIVWADRPEDSSRSTPRVRGGARSSDDGRAIRSSPDSPLEGDGFEPLVPREGIGPFETTLIDLRPFTSAGSNLPRPGVCLRFAPPKSLTLWVNFSLGAVTIGAENFAWLAERATGTPWVPRNPRPIAGPAQVREILQLAA